MYLAIIAQPSPPHEPTLPVQVAAPNAESALATLKLTVPSLVKYYGVDIYSVELAAEAPRARWGGAGAPIAVYDAHTFARVTAKLTDHIPATGGRK